MDVIIKNRGPTCSVRNSLAVALGEPKRVIHNVMSKFTSYETALTHESARINVDTVASFHNTVLDVWASQMVSKAELPVSKLW